MNGEEKLRNPVFVFDLLNLRIFEKPEDDTVKDKITLVFFPHPQPYFAP